MASPATHANIENLRFLNADDVRRLAKEHGTPLFVYSRRELVRQAEAASQFASPFGVRVRYAMKANPHPQVIQLFYERNIWIDASSGPEVEAAIAAGVKPEHILLTTQQLPANLDKLLAAGVEFNASSLHQLETYGKLAPNSRLSVRINPGMGTGMNRRVTTGGVSAAFGIWHQYIADIHRIANEYGLIINQVHTHVGSGTEPDEWLATTHLTLDLMEHFPQATAMSLGGGFRVGRMSHEHSTDMTKISERIAQLIADYAELTGRKLGLEIEPGTFLSAPAGTLITEVVDAKDTGEDGHQFVIIDSGMNDILRPSMYGAQHPLVTVSREAGDDQVYQECIVAGHCCESGDILTVAYGDSEVIEPRLIVKPEIGDYLCIEGTGAYCAGMRAAGYNSFEPAKEILVD